MSRAIHEREVTRLTWVLLACVSCGGATSAGGAGGDGATAGNAAGANGGGGPGAAGGGGATLSRSCAAGPIGSTAMRRLTPEEYNNTLRDLLESPGLPWMELARGPEIWGFDTIAEAQVVPPRLVDEFEQAADRVATIATATANLPRLLKCDVAATGEDACARRFIADFGRRAFRRPLTTDETSRFTTFYGQQKATAGFGDAIYGVVLAFLQSPSFLYRPEFGEAAANGPAVPLSQHEVAARLSYFLTATMPDAALAADADAGRLTTDAVAAHAARLAGTEQGLATMARFHRRWLGVNALAASREDSVQYAMAQELDAVVREAALAPAGRLDTLLAADFTYANQTLAAFYRDLPALAGAGFQKVALPSDRRLGALGLGAFAATYTAVDQSNPVRRGRALRERLLCAELPAADPNVDAVVPMIRPNLTTRERFAAATAGQACDSCHLVLLNPPGYAFENFGPDGRWRFTDNGKPVDASGVLEITEDANGPFAGQADLMRRLAKSGQVHRCYARQFFRHAIGRDAIQEELPDLAVLGARLAAGDGSVRRLMSDVTRLASFRCNAADTGGAP